MGLATTQLGNLPHALRPHEGQIDGGSQSQQSLVRANVARRLFPANMLLAGLNRERVAGAALAICRTPHETARHLAEELVAAGENAEEGPTVLHRDAERLTFGDRDVGTILAGPAQNAQADRIERNDRESSDGMSQFRQLVGFLQTAEEIRMLENQTGRLVVESRFHFREVSRSLRGRHDDEFTLQIGKIRLQHLPVLRMHGAQHHDLLVPIGHAHRHEGGLANRGSPFVKAGVADLHPGQTTDQRLVLEECL